MNYTLLPSIYRDQLLKHENTVYNELLIQHPEEFQHYRRHINVLKKMHLSGLPTRLLEITSNPLVGLYFSVAHSSDRDGEFIIFDGNDKNYSVVKSNVSDTVEILSALVTRTDEQRQALNQIANVYIKKYGDNVNGYRQEIIEAFNKEEPVKYLLHEIRKMTGHFEAVINPSHFFSSVIVKTLQEEPLTRKRSSAFFVTGLESLENESFKNTADSYPTIVKSIDRYRYREENSLAVKRYVVPAEYKEAILLELSFLGIDESYVYPGIQSTTRFLKDLYSE